MKAFSWAMCLRLRWSYPDSVPSPIPLLSPWQKPHSPEALVKELHREVSPQHELYGLPVRALAVARDRDDVLFAVGEPENSRYAVVHLTWSGRIESHPDFPGTEFFHSLADWIEWMKRDHEDYTYGEEATDQ